MPEHLWDDIIEYLHRSGSSSPQAIQHIISISMQTLLEALKDLQHFGFIVKNQDGTYSLDKSMEPLFIEAQERDDYYNRHGFSGMIFE